MRDAENLLGKRFGELVVLERDWTRIERVFWVCICDCGGNKSITAKHLKGGNIKSCGAICHKIGNKNSHWKGYKEVSRKYWNRVVDGALKRNLEISVTIEDVWELFISQNRQCALTGEKLTLMNEDGTCRGFGTASLDRIDNSQGYIKGNIQWIHKYINKLKSNLQQKKLIELCNKVTNHTCQNLEKFYEAFTFI